MNMDILKQILSTHLEDQQVNHYFHSFSSTRKVAEYYASALPNVTSTIEGKKISFFYKDNLIGYIDGQKVSTNSTEARKICNDKFEAEKYLTRENVSTTESQVFNENQYNEALDYIKSSSELKVIKPTMLNGAKGITMNVHQGNFEFAWKNAVTACHSHDRQPQLLVQSQLEGVEIRVLVIEGVFNSAILRAPAHIVGDGKRTVQELIDEKNQLKLLNPHQRTRLIKLDDSAMINLKDAGKQLDSIPDAGEYVFLHYTSNISIGGDPYEISDLLSREIKKIAEDAVHAISGLSTGGVDIMVKSLTDTTPRVLEINAAANLRLHHYPYKGPFRTPIYNLIHTFTIPYL